jgi:hypothetical protein
MMEVVNSILIYFKNFCKCHNVPQYNNYFFKKEKKLPTKNKVGRMAQVIKCLPRKHEDWISSPSTTHIQKKEKKEGRKRRRQEGARERDRERKE